MLFQKVNSLEDVNIAIFLEQFCFRGEGAMRSTLFAAPTRESRPDHNTGNSVPFVDMPYENVRVARLKI